MGNNDAIVQLEKKYSDYKKEFGLIENKKNSYGELNDDTRSEIKTKAHEGLSRARRFAIGFSNMAMTATEGSKEQVEFLNKGKYYIEEVNKFWIPLLQKYGSSISGIPETTFDDIAGLEDVKETIKDYLFLLKNPSVAKAYRINTNLGILLYGPPGTGKTLVAEAIAHELDVRYFVITPSQIFGSYVGESEKNVRDVFEELRACTEGAVLLIDECESIFARRDNNTNRAAIGVANQLLQEMNGQGDSPTGKRVIIGATNRPELMDEAYLRFKRFSLQFFIGMPNAEAKERVVDLRLKNRPCESDFKEEFMRRLCEDNLYTCADISGIVEQCAYMAMSECRKKVESGSELGGRDEFVKMTTKHLDAVLSRYSRSVTQHMLDEYEQFRRNRISGV